MRQPLVALSLLVLAGASHAATLTWPSASAPCNAGLQACIDGATTGDVVELATTAPIALDDGTILTLGKSVTLRNAVGFSPRMADMTYIVIGNAGATGTTRIVVEGIHLPRGRVLATQSVDQRLEVTVRRMRIDNPVNESAAVAFRQNVANGSAAFVGRIEDNDILAEGIVFSGVIYAPNAVEVGGLATNPGPLDVDVAYNRVRAINTGQKSIMSLHARGLTGRTRFHANRIEGRDFNAGIAISSSTGADYQVALANNVIAGQNGNVGMSGGISVYASEGTLRADLTNNTVIHGRTGIRIGARTDLGGMVYGALVNNLVAFHHRSGIVVEEALETRPAGAKGGLPPVFNFNNLVYGNAYEDFTPDESTLTSHPRLQYASFRLREDSPARNAGHPNAVPVLAVQGFPAVDADGLRRVKDAAIDIGAHEVGARSALHVATSANTSSSITTLNWDAINGYADAHFVVTHNWNPPGPSGTYNNSHFGLLRDGGSQRWEIYNQGAVAMPLGVAFNLFLPDAGSGVGHLTNAGNTTAGQTLLSSPELDASSNLLVHARHHWNGYGSAGVALNHPFFVGHFDDAWRLVIPSPATMPLGAGFMLTMQQRSPNAFLHRAASGNISGNWTTIDHPGLNGVRCAQLSVTPSLLVTNPNPIGVWYTGTHHAIYNENGISMPVDANFFVSFDPAQVESCSRAELFGDGFEA